MCVDVVCIFIGYAQLENVEFAYTGQLGFTNNYDPRYSISFVQTGAGGPDEDRHSYVRGCAFHHGYSTAIGLFSCSGIEISDNIIYRTAGAGLLRL